MAMRRRRRKLTNLMSSVDRRLKNVELRQNKGVVTAAAAATDSNANNNIITPPSGVTSGNTPNPWVHVIDGYWYPAQLTGAASGYDRVELWFEADPLTEKDYGVTVSGVKVLNENNVSGTFNVLGDDAPRGADRKSWYVALSNTITNSVLYTTQTTSAYNPTSAPTAKQILSKKLIKSTQANTTTATITFTTSPHYVAGDIISVRDLGSSSSYYGIDGIFKVASANTTSNTITYTFDTPLANSIPSANVASKYVYGVAQKEVGVGNTWLNTTDGLTYYWNGIRYVKWTEGALAADGIAPSPPTSLNLTTEGYNLQGGASGARSKVTASWTAPTTNTDGSALKDLVGYRLWYRDSPSADWIKLTKGSETTQVIDNLASNVTYYFSILAYDSSGMQSTALTGNINTATASLDANVTTSSAPILSAPRLGTVTVTWDGKSSTGGTIDVNKISYVEVHASTTSGFTPVSSSNSATVTAASSNGTTTITYTTSSAHGFSPGQTITITGLSETRFNLANAVLATASGSTFTITNSTAANPSTSISAQTGTARTGTLKGKLYSSTDFLVVSDLAYNTPYYFKFIVVDVSGNATSASAQSTTTIKPLVDTDLIAASLNAPLTNWPFANATITAGALASGAVNSSNMFAANVVVQTAIAANAIGANQIAAGAVVAGKLSAYAVTAGTISALAINAGDINTNAITADKISAGAITAVKIAANAITAEKIEANAINGMTITGATIQTASTNQRVIMAGTQLTFYDSSNLLSGYIYGLTEGVFITGPGGVTAGSLGLYGNSFRLESTSTIVEGGVSASDMIDMSGRVTITGNMSANNVSASAETGSGTAPAYITSTGRLTRTSSSVKYKQDIAPLTISYGDILNLSPVTFRRKDEVLESPEKAIQYAGFIAEELDNTPLGIYVTRRYDEDGNTIPDGISYGEMVSALVIAIKHQDTLIKSLESRISALENK